MPLFAFARAEHLATLLGHLRRETRVCFSLFVESVVIVAVLLAAVDVAKTQK